MWEHYKKTFKSVQAAIAIATVVIYYALGHLPVVTAVFFFTMQLGSVVGAAWANRLRHKFLQP
jgi:hypothetical protein